MGLIIVCVIQICGSDMIQSEEMRRKSQWNCWLCSPFNSYLAQPAPASSQLHSQSGGIWNQSWGLQNVSQSSDSHSSLSSARLKKLNVLSICVTIQAPWRQKLWIKVHIISIQGKHISEISSSYPSYPDWLFGVSRKSQLLTYLKNLGYFTRSRYEYKVLTLSSCASTCAPIVWLSPSRKNKLKYGQWWHWEIFFNKIDVVLVFHNKAHWKIFVTRTCKL